MRILITATHDVLPTMDTRLTTELGARGHHAVHRPLIEVQPKTSVSLPNLADYAVAICVSRHAASLFGQLLKPRGLIQSRPVFFAPGRTTAAYLQRHGIAAQTPARQIGSEAMLAMPELATERVQGKRALLLRGEQGRRILAITLTKRGMHVDQLVLYALVIKRYAASIWRQHFDLIWATSGHILRALAANVQPWFKDADLVVPSRRLAQLAQHLNLGSSRIVTLDNSYAETFMEYVAVRAPVLR